jgi:Flp pilus assembly protein TadD
VHVSLFSDARSQSVEELMAQGDGLLKNGAYAEAVTIFRKVVSKEPRNFEAQSTLLFLICNRSGIRMR